MRVVTFTVCVTIISALVIGCSSPDERVLTKENIEAISKTNEITGEEYQLLQDYLLRSGIAKILAGELPKETFDSTITIRDAIEMQRKFVHDDSVKTKEAEAITKKFMANLEKETEKLRSIVSLTPIGIQFDKYEHQEYNTFKIRVKNRGEKVLKGFKGSLVVYDLFGDHIAELEIKSYKSLLASNESVIESSYSYNKYKNSDIKLRNTNFENMKFSWEPEMIIFDDGEVLQVSDVER